MHKAEAEPGVPQHVHVDSPRPHVCGKVCVKEGLRVVGPHHPEAAVRGLEAAAHHQPIPAGLLFRVSLR